jgi:hypothetical protein
MIMKTVMSGLIAASALAAIGSSASVALTPTGLALNQVQQVQAAKAAQELDNRLPVHKAVWSEQEQRKFWEELENRG